MYLNVSDPNEAIDELSMKKKTVIINFYYMLQTIGIKNLGISDELGPCEVWKKVLCRWWKKDVD